MAKSFIVFEGVDGAGKSVISAAVANRIGAMHLESPAGKFNEIRNYVDDNLCDKGRFLFYLASNFDLSRIIKKHKALEANHIICARYFHSTIIGYASRNNIEIDDIYEKIPVSFEDLERPDITIFLHADKETQRTRIKSRGDSLNSILDYKCLNDESYQERLLANYARTCKKENWIRVDTSTLDEETVINACIAIIGNQ